MKIKLTKEEQEIAKFIAKMRRLTNRENNVKEEELGPQPGMKIEIGGFGAEMAVAKACNVYPDFTTHSRSGGHDLVIRGETGSKRVDVKYTDNPNGNLIAPIKKGWEENGPEVYILVIGVFPEYEIFGWANREDLIREENITDLGYGPTYLLEQDQLYPW